MPDIEPVDNQPAAASDEGGSRVTSVLRPQGPPTKRNNSRRWLLVGGGVFLLVMMVSTLFSSPARKPVASAVQQQHAPVLSLDPSNMQQKSWQAQSQGDIQQLRDEMNQLKADNAQLNKKLQQAQAAPPKPAASDAMPDFMRQHAAGQPAASGNLDALAPPPPPPLPPLPKKGAKDVLPGLSGAVPAPAAADAPTDQPHIFDAPAAPTDGADKAGKSGSASDALTGSLKGITSRYARNAYAGYLPAGSFAPIALLHGLDAAAGATSQANPQPVLMRIQDNAVLPGSAKYQLKSCFALGSAYGDLSSERVYVRLAQLSCIDKQDRLVLNAKLKGYLVDSDGKLGLRGVLVNRQGARLAAALMAGFAQGLSGAFGASMGTTTMSPMMGAGMTVSGSQAMQMAGMGGVSGAAQQLATFYLQQAQAIYPVITVNAGRTGELVIESGTALDWQNTESLYTTTVNAGTGTGGAAGAH